MENSFKRVVVCDFDGTLVRENTMELQLRQAIRKSKVDVFRLIFCIFQGRIAFKKKLTELVPVLDRHLVPNSIVINLLTELRKENRKIFLVSASEHNFVVASGMKIFQFDGIIGSTDVNLKGLSKAQLLVQKFGAKNFEYIGDSYSDVHVWREAYSGFAISPNAKIRRKIQNEFPNVKVLSSGGD